MSNVLLVDTNFSSAPIYQYLIQLGHSVQVVGGNPNDALAKSAEGYTNLDYSNIPEVRKFVINHAIDYLVPGCNDRSYSVCAEVSDGQFPGIDKPETAEVINNKSLFKRFLLQTGLPTPRILTKEEAKSAHQIVVKPVDSFSGKGITLIQKEDTELLESAILLAKTASKTNEFIIEEFVEGQLFSHSGFVRNGTLIEDHIVEEHCTAYAFAVDTSRVLYDFPETLLERIRDCLTIVVKELGLCDGLIHTQFICNGEKFWLIEMTRRCPGDLYSQLIQLSTGFPYAENYARPFLGQPYSTHTKKLHNWIMRHTLTQPAAQTLGSVQFRTPINIESFIPLAKTGERLKAAPTDRIAVLFTRAESNTELIEIYRKTINRDLYFVTI